MTVAVALFAAALVAIATERIDRRRAVHQFVSSSNS
jgi:hypothetical protein